MKNNFATKFMAFFALFWIIIWVVWTGILIMYELYFSENTNNITNVEGLNPEQLNKILESMTWSTNSTWISIENINSIDYNSWSESQ